MVLRLSTTANLGGNGASKCSVGAVIWSLAAWILVIQAYNTIFPPQPHRPNYDDQRRQLPVYRDMLQKDIYEKVERRNAEKPRQKFIDREQILQDAARKAFFFPDKSISINPLKVDDSERFYYYPGREWRDTDGRPIQAHGGGILHVKNTGTFYWYGENKDGRTYRLFKRSTARVDVLGVSCYSSTDLWTWKNEGVVLSPEKENKSSDLHVSNVLERPKVVYNDKSKQFVMWMHIDNGNYTKASVGVAVSSSPVGPFKYLGSQQPHGYDSRDMTIFKDTDNQVYLIYSSYENSELHIGVLTEDYLDLRRGLRRVLVGQHREAPTVFKHKGIYYMVTSGCTGWQPNPAQVHAAESMLGPWETIGDPALGGSPEYRATTFFSQGTFVLPLPGMEDTFIFMADRWKQNDLRDSRYVWLPLTMDGPADDPLEDEFDFPIWQRVSIRWHRKWRLPEGWDGAPAVAVS